MADNGYTDAETTPATDAKGTPAELKDISIARKRLNMAIEATNENRIYQVQDLKFLAGSPDNKYQWPEGIVRMRESDPNGPRPVLTINKLPQHALQVTNEQRQNRPSIKIIPVDDGGDQEVADVLTGIVRHIEYMSDAEVAYATAGESQVAIGEGYLRVLTDYVDETSFDQDIQICGIKNAFCVYMDPVGLQKDATGRFCEWAFVVEDLTDDDFSRQFPDAQPVNWDLVGTGDEWKAWFPDSHTVRIAEYFCFKYEKKTLCLWPDGSTSIKGENAEFDAMVEASGIVPVKERETTVRKLMWQKMSGLEVLEERELPGKYLPVIRMIGNEWFIDGKMVTAGLIRNAKDAQRMFNYWKSTECETLALAPKAPFVGPAEAFEGFEDDWQYANIKNFSFLKYNQFTESGQQIERPQRQTPPMPPVGIVNAALGASDDIKSATGQYDPSLGNNPQAKSGVALAREQRKTDIGTFHYIDNQGRAVKQLGRVLVDIIPKYYDTKRIARIVGEDGETDHVMVDPDAQQAIHKERDEMGIEQVVINPSIGKYDVIVGVGPSFTSKRQEASQMMSEVLQGNPELMGVIGDLYFKMLDVPGSEEIAERLKKMLPPNLADPEDGQEDVIQTHKGPLPKDQVPQVLMQAEERMAALTQALEDAKALDAQNKAKELQIKEQDVKVKMFEAETTRLQMGKEVAEMELHEQEQGGIQAQLEAQAQDGAQRAEATTALMQQIIEQNNRTAEALVSSQQAMLEGMERIAGAMMQATLAMGAPTETEIVESDADGIPKRTRTQRVMQ